MSFNASTCTSKLSFCIYDGGGCREPNALVLAMINTIDVSAFISSDKGHRHSGGYSVVNIYLRALGPSSASADNSQPPPGDNPPGGQDSAQEMDVDTARHSGLPGSPSQPYVDSAASSLAVQGSHDENAALRFAFLTKNAFTAPTHESTRRSVQ